jgi:DNA polymerase IV
MPSVTARRKCPDLIFVKPRFDVYKEVSLQIRAIFAEHTSIIEPLSLDEAYLDMTENLRDIASAAEIAEQIRAKIRAETQLTASAGVSYNKLLAKLASDYCKPDGLFVITPAMGPNFVEALPVERFHGVGPATAARMKELGIFTALDLRTKDETFLLKHFGKAGRHFYWICRGIDHRPVLPNRIRKIPHATFAAARSPCGRCESWVCCGVSLNRLRDESVVLSLHCMHDPAGGSHGKLHRTTKILSHVRRRGRVAGRRARRRSGCGGSAC